MDDVIIQVSTSIGVTVYPQDAADADQLIRHADQAMYMAKQAGKNRFHWFDIEHDEAVKTMHESIENVKQGLLRNEFDLYYQPKVNMRTGECIGVEALIRWLHPDRGVLPPALFLPTIENNEFSVELGDWVITHALEQISAWQNQGLSIPISINISAYELQQSDFVERLEHRLKLFPEVDPGMLELEILETSALEDIGQISDIMINSHKLGVRFALDDFGTGYSSLTYLKRLPANSLKIDQSFVRDMIDDKDDLAIVEGVIGLAKAFNRDAIAEGVESSEHGEMLIELGCEYAQGYGIAKPMPAKELSAWLSTWRPPASWTKDHYYTI
jgi:EAL domain-containing protein (putative c-di-GMP-specific phosphodiesterase class I)